MSSDQPSDSMDLEREKKHVKREHSDDDDDDDDEESFQGRRDREEDQAQLQEVGAVKLQVVLPETQATNKWRACVICQLIKTEKQFREDGCENCKDNLEKAAKFNIRKNDIYLGKNNFEGIVSVMEPRKSWVLGKLLIDRQKYLVPGMYALKVNRTEGILEFLADNNIDYARNK